MSRIGILALQGGFELHKNPLRRLGHEPCEVRTPSDLVTVEGLVLPGGESTTQLKLLAGSGLEEAIVERVGEGMPVLATCAGMILAARRVPGQRSLGLIDIAIERNAYGRQVASFEAVSDKGQPLMFIRAPRIVAVGDSVEVLDRLAGEPILVAQGRVIAASFHPELTQNLSVHQRVFGCR